MLRCYLGMALHKLKRNKEALDELGQVGDCSVRARLALGCLNAAAALPSPPCAATRDCMRT